MGYGNSEQLTFSPEAALSFPDQKKKKPKGVGVENGFS